jgi:hypothetical protein
MLAQTSEQIGVTALFRLLRAVTGVVVVEKLLIVFLVDLELIYLFAQQDAGPYYQRESESKVRFVESNAGRSGYVAAIENVIHGFRAWQTDVICTSLKA